MQKLFSVSSIQLLGVQVKIEYILALPWLNRLNIHLLLPEFRVHNVGYCESFFLVYCPSVRPTSHKSKQRKIWFYNLQYGPRKHGQYDIYFISGFNAVRGAEFHFKQTFEFSRLYIEINFFLIAHSIDQSYSCSRPHSEIQPTKLTNHGALTN